MALFKKAAPVAQEQPQEPVVEQEVPTHFELAQSAVQKELAEAPFRKKGESLQAYNERIPVALQPTQPAPTHSYLGKKL